MNKVLAAGLMLMGAAASAQTPQTLGTVADVQGIVTVSNGTTVGTAVRGTVISQGNHFVTASAGAARLTMDNGCVIHLKPNQSLRIDSRLSCEQLIASIQPVAGAPVTASAGVTPGALAVGAALTAVVVGDRLGRGGQPAAGAGTGTPDPGSGGSPGTPDPGGGGVLPNPDISGR
jgi:hypothetical protein